MLKRRILLFTVISCRIELMDEPKGTGKKLEGLVMEENKDDQASVIMRRKMAAAAREVWSKVKSFVVGKVVRKDEESGSLVVCEVG